MHFTQSFLAIGLAALAVAAPVPEKSLAKRHFAIPVKGRHLLRPAEEMYRAYRKYGWQIIFLNPDDGQYSPFPPTCSETVTAVPGTGAGPSSEPPFPVPSTTVSLGGSFSTGVMPSVSLGGSFSTGVTPSVSPPGYFSTGVIPPVSSALPSVDPVPTTAVATPEPSAVLSSSALSNGTTPSSAAPPVATSATPSGDGETAEVTATPEENDSEYLAPVSIGGQTLNLNFDTGSADLWVFSTELPSGEQSGHSLYDPSKSSTVDHDGLDGYSWQIQYGDGSSASGNVVYDQVVVGAATVTKQAVELATYVAAQFLRDENSDGLVGLSFSVLNTVEPKPQKTWFDNVQDSLESPLFTADLEEDTSGTYEFGTIDTSKYSGELYYTPVDNSQGWWQFDSKSIKIGGDTVQCSICSPAIADTGTSLLLLDDDLATAYYDKVPTAKYDSRNGGYAYECDAQLPDFSLAIGDGYMATLTGKELTYAEIGDGTCFGGIQGNGASQGGTPVQIVGAVLLKQYFAVFDAGNMQFGIAKKN